MDGRRIGQFQLIELAEAVDDGATIEVDSEFALVHVAARYYAEVAIVDLPVVIDLDAHDLVAWAEGPAEAFDADLSGRVQSLLQLDIE